MSKINAIDLVMAEQWSIVPEGLRLICAIATRANENPESILKKDGTPLDNTRSVQLRNGVAIIPVTGPLFRRANLFTEISGASSYEVMAKEFNEALENDQVESIVLNIDSPGGMVNGASEFADLIFAARNIKPITSYVSDMGTSAAYWIASAGGDVVINKTARVGSIGVVVSARKDKDTGMIEIVSSNAPNKRLDPSTESGREKILNEIDDIEAVFIDQVAKFRGISRDEVLSDFGQGGTIVGAKAVSAGMADRVGTLESVIAGLSGNLNEVLIMGDSQKDNTPDITAEYIAANHPDIADTFRNEGKASIDVKTIQADAAKAELERIQAVSSQTLAGHETLIESLMFDGKTTGEQAAVQVLNAEKAKQSTAGANLKDLDNAPPAVVDPKQSDSAKSGKSDEDKWDSDEELRAEFGDNKDSYLAYVEADKNGSFKTIGGKQ